MRTEQVVHVSDTHGEMTEPETVTGQVAPEPVILIYRFRDWGFYRLGTPN